MKRYARIEDGKVAEIVTLEDGFAIEECFPPELHFVEVEDDAEVGWSFDGGAFGAPEPVHTEPAVPTSVTKAQAKIALHRAGILDAVKTAVAGDAEMQIWFEDAAVWERQNPHVIALGEGALGLTSADIDELFVQAAQIAA